MDCSSIGIEESRNIQKWFEMTDIPSNNSSLSSISSEATDILCDSSTLKFELLRKNQTEEFQKIFETRQTLAVIRQCRVILNAIREHQVILVVGSTGCGKTTQIPQMILDDAIFNDYGTECCIACVQTGRDAAITAAKRVAYERIESLGNSVGFLVGGRKALPRESGSILYCTSYFIIKKINTDPMLTDFNVVILDDIQDKCGEFHELMERLKNVLQYRFNFKVILLSTTASEDTFCKYFNNYHAIYVHETPFPITKKSPSISTLNESIRHIECDDTIMVSDRESSASGDSAKRSRTGDQITTRANKRRKLSSLNGREHLQVAIIDRCDPHGRINDDKWLRLEKQLLTEMVSNKWSNEGIYFDGANWSRGVKLVRCGNDKSLDFLKATIGSVGEFWPGARLEVVALSSLPRRTFARMWIPPPVPSTNVILTLIEKQNDGLDTKNWKIIGCSTSKTNSGKEYCIFIDGNSLRNVRKCQGRIRFGLNFIRIRTKENTKKLSYS